MSNRLGPGSRTVTVNVGALAGTEEMENSALAHIRMANQVTDAGEIASHVESILSLLFNITIYLLPVQVEDLSTRFAEPLSSADAREIRYTTMFPFSLFSSSQKTIVDQDCRLVLWRLGRIPHKQPLGPGTVKYYPNIDSIDVIKTKLDTFKLDNLDFITRDMRLITASFSVNFRVEDPIKALLNVKDYTNSLSLVSRSKLRDLIANHDYEDLKMNRTKIIDQTLLAKINLFASRWGIRVDSVFNTDLKPKGDYRHLLPKSMASAPAAP